MKKIKIILATVLIFFAGGLAGGALVFRAIPNPVQQQVQRLNLLKQFLSTSQGIASSEQVRGNVVGWLGIEMGTSAGLFAWADESNRQAIVKIARWVIDEDIYGTEGGKENVTRLLVAHCIADNATTQEGVRSCMEKISARQAFVWQTPPSE